MRFAILSLAGALALAACGKPPEKAAGPDGVNIVASEPPAPNAATAPAASDAAVDTAAAAPMTAEFADMVDCAGVYGALGDIDPTQRQQDRSNPWLHDFAGIQMSILTLPDSPGAGVMSVGMTQRLAYWKAQDPAAQAARGAACKAKY